MAASAAALRHDSANDHSVNDRHAANTPRSFAATGAEDFDLCD